MRRVARTLVVTIDRPDKRNAVDAEVTARVAAAFAQLESDDDLAVGILTGAGGTFCSGADLGARVRGEAVVDDHGFAGFTRLERTKPVIAAVEGYALGGGMELVLACDLVVAADDAMFGLPEASRSVLAAEGGLYRSVSRLGRNAAMELALTGERLSAGRAHTLGLVNRLVVPGDALDEALSLAARIADNAPEAVRQSRRVIAAAEFLDEDESWELSQQAYAVVKRTEDFRDGARAFLEGRKPRWQLPPEATSQR